jgi:hypothetical protein
VFQLDFTLVPYYSLGFDKLLWCCASRLDPERRVAAVALGRHPSPRRGVTVMAESVTSTRGGGVDDDELS